MDITNHKGQQCIWKHMLCQEGYCNDCQVSIDTKKRIEDLLCGAFEGGSNYWYFIEKFNYPEGQNKKSLGIEFAHIELPFKGGSLTITTPEEEDGKEYILDEQACIRGLNTMAEKYPRHYADWLAENDDAITADVYLQCCLFGELVYG